VAKSSAKSINELDEHHSTSQYQSETEEFLGLYLASTNKNAMNQFQTVHNEINRGARADVRRFFGGAFAEEGSKGSHTEPFYF